MQGDSAITIKLNKKLAILLGGIACIGAFAGIIADIFSIWSTGPGYEVNNATLNLESFKLLYAEKARWTFVTGHFLGILFLPLHITGFILVYWALKPAGTKTAWFFFIAGTYLTVIGTGYHGSFAFVGDIIQSGNQDLQLKMLSYWLPWGGILSAGFFIVSAYLVILIIQRKTIYPLWFVFISPLAIISYQIVIALVTPMRFSGIKAFFAVTIQNLPLLVLYTFTTFLLIRNNPTTEPSYSA